MRRSASQPPELPGYTFVRLLGSGGFSDVFLYEQELPRRRVAVKVLLTEELVGANRAAFVAEANLMAQLSAHPYIVTIYHADVASDDRPYFVMEYCSGPSLAERYKQETFQVADALRTGVRLSSAVATAHSAGILHRDIKPANVLGNDYGWPALTDFGISSALDDELPVHTGTLASALSDAATGTGGTESASVGMSVPWSPPEMFEDDPQPDVRSDVFSLAATIYTVLAGQTPFEVRGRSNGTLDLIGRIERGAITPLARQDVPRSLVAVLQKGMASDRNDRFATAVDFARALQRVELELGYSPTAIDVPNLLIEAPHRSDEADDADATRARSVATIDAQPAAPMIVPPVFDARPGSDAPAAAGDSTVVRTPQNIAAQPVDEATVVRRTPVVAETVEPAADTEAPPRGRGKWLVWGGVAAAVLIAGAVTAGILLGGDGEDIAAGPTPGASGDAIVIDTIPTPTVGSVVPGDTTLTVTVINPDPLDGDEFVWRRYDRPDEASRAIDDGVIVIKDYTPGDSVCLEVSVKRGTKASANALEECFPQ
ncbi:serine/threonine protein kinase [Conyzicola lurida]|uniref:non-specific serine/threonine protein kinase n=1 Tax=Conyzicola lurida TaxID=1172621 RepID=A0A841AQR6_9MICO|nr:serine/threonine-protein kinase [Conyzicola lurida]MBB5843933.1 serine/threonine protein kinase [Conyzicola lurida]